METTGLNFICNVSPNDTKQIRNLIDWIWVVVWKLIDPRVQRRPQRNYFNALICLIGAFVAWGVENFQPDFIDKLIVHSSTISNKKYIEHDRGKLLTGNLFS